MKVKGRVNSTLLPSNENMKKLYLVAITALFLANCSGQNTPQAENAIDCQVESNAFKAYGRMGSYSRYFRSFTNDKWSQIQDGEVAVTIKTDLSIGEYKFSDLQTVPYRKTGNTFTETWSEPSPYPSMPYELPFDNIQPNEDLGRKPKIEVECLIIAIE